jgi:hypothetical protein
MSGRQEMASSSTDSVANVRTTLLMFVGTATAGVLYRARKQPNVHRVRGLLSRTSPKGKARPRAAERGSTDE